MPREKLSTGQKHAPSRSRDSIEDVWGERTSYCGEGQWPVRIDELLEDEPDEWVQSACVLCSNGCGLDLGVKNGRLVGVRGRSEDVVNRGRLGPKGLHGWRANHSPDRLTRPLIRSGSRLLEASWDDAMSLIAEKSKQIVERYTASAIGFYTSGQLMLEEYYTLGMIGKAGLGTPHMDGNTRLCTATAAAALKEAFGSDGQPGSFYDIDETDCILLVGHNLAETDTVLWMRVLDRRRGPRPPKLIAIDTRETPTTREADLHLAPKPGANVPVLNGLINLVIENGAVDHAYVEGHTVGFEQLKKTVASYTPDRVEQLSGVPAQTLIAVGRILSETKSLVSTVLQGVYQSMQATAAACQVNNLNLIRGMIGKPGCGILQMNGQPTSQNTRETGADGDLPGFRNWDNPDHIADLARVWNVDPAIIPHWAPPTHLIEMGFLEFVKKHAAGPLFYDPARSRGAAAANPAYKKVGGRIAAWVRKIGVDDPEVAPNHGWRHRMSSILMRLRARKVEIDAILGHKGPRYGKVEMRVRQALIESVPRIEIGPLAPPNGQTRSLEDLHAAG